LIAVIGVVGALFIILLFTILPGPSPTPTPTRDTEPYSLDVLSQQKRWVTGVEARIDDLQNQLARLRVDLDTTNTLIGHVREDLLRNIEQLQSLPGPRPEEGALEPLFRSESRAMVGGRIAAAVEPIANLASKTPQPPLTPTPPESAEPHEGPKATAFIPAGSFASASVLAGILAPSEGPPYPVQILVTEPFNAPNEFLVNLKGCFLIGEAEGNLVTRRALVKVNTLACVFRDGRTIEVPVRGYLTGPDSMMGIPGKVVSRQGSRIALAMLAAGAESGAEAAAEREVTRRITESGTEFSTVTGEPARYAGYEALGAGARTAAQFWLRQAEKMVDVVEVGPGTPCGVILLKGVKIDYYLDQERLQASGFQLYD
jgi:conjugal transfer pilus assembly protein TraB